MRFLVLISCLALVTVSAAYGRTWHVPAEAPTIQAAIDSATADDVIQVACGTYFEWGLTMTAPITLRSETGDPDCVIIGAMSVDTVFYCDWSAGTASVEGITITGGNGELSGGVLMTGAASIDFIRCNLLENYGGHAPGGGRGGGVGCMDQSRALFQDCHMVGNGAYGGGGIYCEGQAEIGLESCLLVNNSSVWGGGVEVRDTSICTITSCTIFGNYSDAWYGAGVTSWSSTSPQITRTIIAFSVAGSAVYGICELTDCDLFGNEHGDWVGDITEQIDLRGNFYAPPCFCDAVGGDFFLCADSYCLPENNPWGRDELVGAYGEGCVACDCPSQGPVQAEDMSWGSLKTLYR